MKYQTLYLIIYVSFVFGFNRNVSRESDLYLDETHLAWLHLEPWQIHPPGRPEPPSPLSPPPSPHPPQPPATPPPPPEPPGTPPPPPQPPGYQSLTNNGPLADDIRCNNFNGKQIFTAVVTLPDGFRVSPVFNDAANLNHRTHQCLMKQSRPEKKTFNLQVTDFTKCGVSVHSTNGGRTWMSLTVRFPYIEGLRLAEDEYAMLICRPQDRKASRKHVIEVQGNMPRMPKPIFRNLPHQLECKIGLFIKTAENDRFDIEISPGSAIRIGQEVQLRAAIRADDGWRYAAMTDVIVQKVGKSSEISYVGGPSKKKHFIPSPRFDSNHPRNFESNNFVNYENLNRNQDTSPNHLPVHTAHLVFENGCRNVAYRAIATRNPFTDPSSSLVVNFNFKTFMFEDMEDGDSIRISATIFACAEEIDCHQILCNDKNYIRHRRTVSLPETLRHHLNKSSITREFDVRVILPGYVKALATSRNGSEIINDTEEENILSCKLFAIVLSIICLIFCVAITIAATVALKSKRKAMIINDCAKYVYDS